MNGSKEITQRQGIFRCCQLDISETPHDSVCRAPIASLLKGSQGKSHPFHSAGYFLNLSPRSAAMKCTDGTNTLAPKVKVEKGVHVPMTLCLAAPEAHCSVNQFGFYDTPKTGHGHASQSSMFS